MSRKFISSLLILCMFLTALPNAALAADEPADAQNTHVAMVDDVALEKSPASEKNDIYSLGEDVAAISSGLEPAAETRAAALASVYLDPKSGDDTADGATASAAVKSLGRAFELVEADGTINLLSPIEIADGLQHQTIASPADKGMVAIRRKNNVATMLYVGCWYEVTLQNIILDGNKEEYPVSSIPTDNTNGVTSGLVGSHGYLVLGEGLEIKNNAKRGVTAHFWGTGPSRSQKPTDNPTISMPEKNAVLIQDASIHDNGGGLHISSVDTVMESGSIYNNTAQDGGAVQMLNAEFTMLDGEIYGNKSEIVPPGATTNGGGAFYMTNGADTILNIKGGSIHDNASASIGGAISAITGKVNISDGRVYNNRAASLGGAIYGLGAIRLTDTKLYNNTSGEDGGCIYGIAAVNISGGQITGNHAERSGGGIYYSSAADSLKTEGDLVFCNNTAATSGADLASMGTVTLPAAGDINQIFNGTDAPIDGWYQDKSGNRFDPITNARPVDISAGISGAQTLVAAYTKQYKVAYELNGGIGANGTDYSAQNVKPGAAVAIKTAPTKEGYRFLGWLGGEIVCQPDENLTVTADITLTAQWTPLTSEVEPVAAAYRVEYYKQQPDGSCQLAETEFPLYGKIGESVSAQLKTYAYYHVDQEHSLLSGKVIKPVVENGEPKLLTLKVYYDLDTYTVSYDLNGGTGADGVDYSAETIKHGNSVTIKDAPTRQGHIFTGWTADTATYRPGDTVTVSGSLTLTAQWERSGGSGGGSNNAVTVEYTLHYQSNGGTAYKNERYDKNTVVQLDKTPLREGHTFTGWYADQALSAPITSMKMTEDKTVYAGWRETAVPKQLNGDDHIAYVVGYTDGTVRPMANISRAEVATIFFRLLKEEVRESNLTQTNSFADVVPGMWCNTPVSTMAALGLVQGRSADRFESDAPITRAEFATVCARFETGLSEANHFTDITGHWAEDSIKRAATLGWIQGYEDDTFRPDRYITRAEAMIMINRVLHRLPADKEDVAAGANDWPDNDQSAWYYLSVLEATHSHDYELKQHNNDIHEQWTGLTNIPDWTRYEN